MKLKLIAVPGPSLLFSRVDRKVRSSRIATHPDITTTDHAVHTDNAL
jgi:hypothetical protein